MNDMAEQGLRIDGLRVNVAGTEILKGIDLTVEPGTVHALMGPNGSGKSTLAFAMTGHPNYDVTAGSVTLDGEEPARTAAGQARPGRALPLVPIPGRHPGRLGGQLPARRAPGRPPRRPPAREVPPARLRADGRPRHGRRLHGPLRQRRLLRRRKEAARDAATRRSSPRSTPSSTRPIPVSTSTRSGPSATPLPRCARATPASRRGSSSSPTIRASCSTSPPTSCTS